MAERIVGERVTGPNQVPTGGGHRRDALVAPLAAAARALAVDRKLKGAAAARHGLRGEPEHGSDAGSAAPDCELEERVRRPFATRRLGPRHAV